MFLTSTTHHQAHQIAIETLIMLTVLTVNATNVINPVVESTINGNVRSTADNQPTGSTGNNSQATVTIDHQVNNNQNQSFTMELRERKRKERLSLIKSSILSQLGANLPNQHHHQHNNHLNHLPDQHDSTTVNHNQPCQLTNAERNILSEIFIMIKKTPEGTIDVNQFLTNPQIVDKLQGLQPNSYACVRTAILASIDHQRGSNSLNSTLTRPYLFPINTSSSSVVLGHHLFDQSGLSNKSLSDYQNDNATQQLILEQRQRRRQERLIFIQQQILSRLGLTQRANETLPPCKLTESDRVAVDQVFNSKSSSEPNLNQLTQSNMVFSKLQGFYPSCKLNLMSMNTNQPNNSIPS